MDMILYMVKILITCLLFSAYAWGQNLTPEQKAIGKQNFNAAIGSELLRRDFLRKGIEQNIASGAGLGPYYFGYDKTIGEPLRVGVLGPATRAAF